MAASAPNGSRGVRSSRPARGVPAGARRARGWLVALLLAAAGARAAADEPRDFDARAEEERGFWAQVLHPNRARYREQVGEAQALLARRGFAEAAALLEAATRLEPGLPEAWYLLGRAHYAQQHWQACADAYLAVQRLAPAFHPGDEQAGVMDADLGACLSLCGRYEEAIAAFQRALASGAFTGRGQADSLHYNMGEAYHALGRLDDAVAAYRRAIAIGPQTPLFHLALGVALDRDGQVSAGQDEVREALRYDPTPGLNHLQRVDFAPPEEQDYYRGLAHAVAGRRTLAIVHFRRYVRAAAGGPWERRAQEHLVELGSAHLADGDVQLVGQGALERGRVVKAVLAAAPELEKCLEGEDAARVTVRVNLTPAAARTGRAPPAARSAAPPAPRTSTWRRRVGIGRSRPAAPQPLTPGVWVSSDGPQAASPQAAECVTERARRLKLPAPTGAAVGVVFSVIAP